MGAPKQKWTAEEESALKSGVIKHGVGRWRAILKDPEFSGILHLRSNVDLKDKWRNMGVMASGCGPRERSRVALKQSHQFSKHDDNRMTLSTVVEDFDDEIVGAKPLAISSGTLQITGPRKSAPRLDNLILEAITNLREPSGSNMMAIHTYIEGQYWPPPDFKGLLSAKLKTMIETGKLIKVKRNYRIARSSCFSRGRSSRVLHVEGRQHEYPRVERDDLKMLTKSQIDDELAQMRNMTAHAAAAAAAQAVAEAEAAMLEAEAAAREAEAAEADAEAAQAFAEAAKLTLKKRNAATMMVRL